MQQKLKVWLYYSIQLCTVCIRNFSTAWLLAFRLTTKLWRCIWRCNEWKEGKDQQGERQKKDLECKLCNLLYYYSNLTLRITPLYAHDAKPRCTALTPTKQMYSSQNTWMYPIVFIQAKIQFRPPLFCLTERRANTVKYLSVLSEYRKNRTMEIEIPISANSYI